MKRVFVIAIAGATALAGYAQTASTAAASESAAPPRSIEQVRQNALAAMNAGELQEVRKHGWRGGRSYRGHRWNHRGRYGHRHYHRRGGGGRAAAAGIAGFAAGAIIGSAAAQANERQARTRDWCASRYRSYDPRSGTYLGNSGRRYACP